MRRRLPWLGPLLDRLDSIGAWLPQIALRLLLAYEFGTSGLAKWHGANWFHGIRDQLPAPFNLIPAELSWNLAMLVELAGSAALVLGAGTRLTSLILSALTVVGALAMQAGNGYNVCDNGWKLPLIYLVLFLPLIFSGPGKLSIDFWWRKHFKEGQRRIWT
jgi:putative oxidoreductase